MTNRFTPFVSRALLALMLFAFMQTNLIENANAFVMMAGDRVNNGGGLAEKNVLLATQNLERYIGECEGSLSCRLSEKEAALLGKIVASLKSERKNEKLIAFLSERKNPGFFLIDGEMKIAKTGDDISDTIYVNVDLLYSKNAVGGYEALSLPDAVALLVHEFGHHHGVKDHTALDLLGLKVASQMRRLTYTTPLLPMSDQIALHVINGTRSNPFPDLILSVTDNVYEVTSAVRKSVVCPLISLPISVGPIDPITIPSHKPYGFLLHNVHWAKIADGEASTTFQAVGNLTLDCKGKGLVRGNTDFSLYVNIVASKVQSAKGGYYVWKVEQVRVWQARIPWLRLLSFPWM